MKKFEYASVYDETDCHAGRIAFLNEMGEDGWEVVKFDTFVYFKREKVSDRTQYEYLTIRDMDNTEHIMTRVMDAGKKGWKAFHMEPYSAEGVQYIYLVRELIDTNVDADGEV